MSPYEEKYVDVKYIGDLIGSSTITVEEVSQQWRLWFLAVGFILLLLALSISSWVHFYYSTSMVIVVFMVIIFLLIQL
ncbi:putative NEMP family protein [Rosa chinensis]|uniref:Putative NEMP family protein n=1 Tax=Rosa chinensis TaxID=74649 RepID=A0A2P6PCP5_ROSCH|nr:putative NEMP family protein [Rosa chinensis]